MNFLAHFFLSGEQPEWIVGNFIADFIRGNQFRHLPPNIQQGITLHRFIDSFTDSHPTVRQSTKRLHEHYHKFSGVVVDIYHDHFLAKNWLRHSSEPLEDFANRMYATVQQYKNILPEKVQEVLPYMIKHNWLVNYAHFESLEDTFQRLAKRIEYKSPVQEAVATLQQNYEPLETDFSLFFEEIKQATNHLHHTWLNTQSSK
ncbi:MAG: DUF479 domain-containing protein [Cytophagales bacterium]|nr:MAG: DUF479 domain-containing protein [Cytophagales bacterium]